MSHFKLISAETVLRTSLRTPNISQLSPTPSLSVSNTSISTHLSSTSFPTGTQLASESPISPASNSPSGSTQAAAAQRLQLLKQRKSDLEKILLEKNSLLQQLCRQEAQIIGCYDFETNDGKSSTLRRKVNTAFKLPENLLNDKEDEINKLLLGKQIQQQISEASLKLANDLSQTKSIRRTHKSNYDAAQQKLMSINQSLSALKKRQNCDVASPTNISFHTQFKQGSPILKTDSKYATNNNNFLHPTSQGSPTPQFSNNNFIGNAVNSHQLLMKAYSTHGNVSPNINNNHSTAMQRRNSLISNTSSTNLDVVPTTPTSSRHRHDSLSAAAPLLDYGGGYHVHYNANTFNNNKSEFAAADNLISQQKLKKSALLDNDYSLQRYSPISCDTDTFTNYHHNHYNQYSPGDIITPSPEFRASSMGRQMLAKNANATSQSTQLPTNHRLDNATFTQPMMIQSQRNPYNQRLDVAVDDCATNEQLNGRLVSPPISSKGTLMVHQGLGGYWMTLENNERVWCPVDR